MQSVSCRFPMVTFNPATQAGTANIHAFLKEAISMASLVGTATGGAETRFRPGVVCLSVSPSHPLSARSCQATASQNVDCIQLLLYHSGHTYSRGLKESALPLATGADLRPKCRAEPYFLHASDGSAQVSQGDLAVDERDHLGARPLLHGAKPIRERLESLTSVALEEPAAGEDEPDDQREKASEPRASGAGLSSWLERRWSRSRSAGTRCWRRGNSSRTS